MEDPRLKQAVDEIRKNERQWAAFESNDNFVVLAGPGSGKTKLLATKMASIINELPPPRGVACITYSTECVRELRRRLANLGVRSRGRIFIGTVHSLCLEHILRPFAGFLETGLPKDFAVASNRDQAVALQAAIDEVLPYQETAAGYRVSFDRYRRTLLDREGEEWKARDDYLPKVIESYEQTLHENGLIDFDDMVLAGLRLVSANEWIGRVLNAKFPFMFVDEYQDLGLPLHELVLDFLASGIKLFVVGDPDQYYRSKQMLMDGAVAVLNEAREYIEAPGDHADTDEPIIEFVECPEGIEQQAEAILDRILPQILDVPGRSLGDVAILYPNENLGDVIASAANSRDIPNIRIDQGAPYPKTPFTRWLEDCAAWCAGGWEAGEPGLGPILEWSATFALSEQMSSGTERWRVKVQLTRFLWNHRDPGMPLLEWLSAFWSEVLEQQVKNRPDEAEVWARVQRATAAGGPLEEWPVEIFGGQAGSPRHLNLITLHSAKSREFDAVVMMGMDQGLIPPWNANSEGAKREPRRLFYVGMTRARYRIYMTYSGFTVAPNGRIHRNGPSEFLLELQDAIAKR